MDTLLQADIFFFVTTIAVILVTATVVAVLIYGALIARDIHAFTKRVREEGDAVFEDIRSIREMLMSERHRIFDAIAFFGGIVQQVVASRTSEPKKKTTRRRAKTTRKKKTE